MKAGDEDRDELGIDEKARNGIADLAVKQARCQASVDQKLNMLLDNQEKFIARVEPVISKVEDHDFWIRAGKRFMAGLSGIGVVVAGAWARVKLGL